MLARRRTVSRAARRALLLLGAAVLAGASATGCSTPPSHFTRLWVQGRTGVPMIGVSTEGGILTLSAPDRKPGDRFDLQFPHGNSLVNDVGIIDRMNETITIIRPATSRLSQARFATSLPAPQEQLYIALRDELDEPVMQPVALWRNGEYGDWILMPGLDEDEVVQLAQQYRGTGLYVKREGRWEIVGLLAGLLAGDDADPRGEVALGYVGLTELTRILPREKDYLLPDIKPLRPDFEFGVPLQPGDLVIEPAPTDSAALMRWVAAAATAWVFLGAALSVPQHAGVLGFGDPPEQALLWAAAALVWAAVLLRAPDRAALARGLTLAVLAAALLGERGVPADPGLVVVLLGLALLAAAPSLRATPSLWLATACLALSLPGLIGTVFPHGALLWLLFTLPAIGLLPLLPALFPGRRAATPCLALLLATAAFAMLSLATYPGLAFGLDLPLAALAGTRLRVMGLHPNLAVPLLVAASLIGAALAWDRPGRTRRIALACLVPTLVALLCVRSRTGLLALLLGALLLASARLAPRWSSWATRLLAAAVVLMLLMPVAGLGETRITERTTSMVSKAASFREAMWELGRDTFAAAPWHGFGPGTFLVQGGHARPGPLDGHAKDDHPHSVVLAVGEAFGWPGLAALTALFVAALRRPRDGDRLGAGLRAALLAVFAANAIDLGGAQNTLYPAVVFVLLGLAHAARRDETAAGTAAASGDEPAAAAVGAAAAAPTAARVAASSPMARLVAPLALLLIAFGLFSWAGAAVKRHAAAQIAQGEDADVALARAARLLPLDPDVPVLAARQAEREHDRAGRVEQLERARALLPVSSDLAQALASARAAIDPADRRVDALLDEAAQLDPLGERAWSLHRDRAVVFALRDEAPAARDALLAALLLNPEAASDFVRTGQGSTIELFPGGPAHVGVSLADLRTELARRRDAAAADPGELLRLSIREVELLKALQAWDDALATARTLLGADPFYLQLRVAAIEMARGNPGAAVAPLEQAASFDNFWAATDLVSAVAGAPASTQAEFDAAVSGAIGQLRSGQADLYFDLPKVIELLAARQRWDERQGDAVAAARCADALDFARR